MTENFYLIFFEINIFLCGGVLEIKRKKKKKKCGNKKINL